jgi:thiamine biosynthesis lipoprotein
VPAPSVFLLTPALAVIASAQAGEWRFHADGVLGTRLDVAVSCPSAEAARRAAEAALAEISRLDRLLSWRDSGSELARLNSAERMAVSPELFEVLARAAHWRAVSGGAFDERMGRATRLWRLGEAEAASEAARAARGAGVQLEPAGRFVRRNEAAILDLDAIAKGYVIDRALAAARGASPGMTAAMVSIGGDIAGWRADGGAWRIGLPQAGMVADNAPLEAVVDLADGAIATSGRGPRDVVVNGTRIGPALSPHDGAPAEAALCATARASCAMDADALATIALVLPPAEALAVAERTPDAALRIVGVDGRVSTSSRWRDRPARRELLQPRALPIQLAQPPAAGRWPIDWELALWYRLPDRRDRGADFREPYMAVWVTDANNRPVRTLFMVGRNPDWQRDNFIWWSSYRARAAEVIDAKSQSTAPTGRYAFMWDGRDDAGTKVPAGAYAIHVETSRERGTHTHRSLPVQIGSQRFVKTMPPTPAEGGFTAVFAHYNDLRDYDPE